MAQAAKRFLLFCARWWKFLQLCQTIKKSVVFNIYFAFHATFRVLSHTPTKHLLITADIMAALEFLVSVFKE